MNNHGEIVITARIQRMGEGTVFSLFVSPHLDGGGPHPRSGHTPFQVQMGGGEYSLRSGWGVPPCPGLDGVHPPPSGQISIASTCYAAGGVPLAFTQEDFLVINVELNLKILDFFRNTLSWHFCIA